MSLHLATSSLNRLAIWFNSVSGRRLLAEQAPLIGECARRFHGDTLLWAGCHTDLTDTVRGCMVRHRFYLETCAAPLQEAGENSGEDTIEGAADGESSRFRADLHELPLPNNIIDAVVLHHVLETAEDPRTAIREVARALAPGGRLLIVSFNPWSLWGVRGAYARFFRDSFSGLRFVRSGRLLDWLTVLGFELQDDVKYLAYTLPFSARKSDPEDDETKANETSLWHRFRRLCSNHGLPLGGVYVISAVKQANAIRPDWNLSTAGGPKLVPAAYPKLSARVAQLPVRSDTVERTPIEGIEDPG